MDSEGPQGSRSRHQETPKFGISFSTRPKVFHRAHTYTKIPSHLRSIVVQLPQAFLQVSTCQGTRRLQENSLGISNGNVDCSRNCATRNSAKILPLLLRCCCCPGRCGSGSAGWRCGFCCPEGCCSSGEYCSCCCPHHDCWWNCRVYVLVLETWKMRSTLHWKE